jgi:mannose-1-phosphate guanylyltransferase
VTGDFGWYDVGDLRTVHDVLPADAHGNVVIARPEKPSLLLHDTQDVLLVPQGDRLIATIGLRDLIIVDTPDALLVCPVDRAQDVKATVDEIKQRGDTQYL